MGNAVIWYYPHPHEAVIEIDLGGPLSDLQLTPQVEQDVSLARAGRQATAHVASFYLVRVIVERTVSAATARALMLLLAHLQRGGLCMVAEDKDKAYASLIQTHPVLGDTLFGSSTIDRMWEALLTGTITLASGDTVVLQGSASTGIREALLVSSHSGTTVNLSTPIAYPWTRLGPKDVLIARHEGFWPALRMPARSRGQRALTHDHRNTYTLDLALEEDVDALAIAAEEIPRFRGSTTGVGSSWSEVLDLVP